MSEILVDRERSAREACDYFNYSAENLTVIRHGSNSLYHSNSDGIVIRVHNESLTLEQVTRELRVAEHLSKRGVKAATPPTNTHKAYSTTTNVVSIWEYLKPGEKPTHYETALGQVLNEFHLGMDSYTGEVPNFDPLRKCLERLKKVNKFQKEKDFLTDKVMELASLSIHYQFEYGVVHGDFHTGNIIWNKEQPFIIDFEAISKGYRDHDFAPIWVTKNRFLPDLELDSISLGYKGSSEALILDDSVLEIRELTMLCWLIETALTSNKALIELKYRIDTLKQRKRFAKWNPL